ncbi:UNVERIFIED_CONTAM: hypothetical protein Sangu_2919900 [Sesamum angustifolium]|uniref:Reverse transcriptase zinc-binding domain-containing protein n=1 Tax=Sesamum angustifolium TaxID=2727405 RepID=A0AAW2ILZ1_9LAMI
MLGLLIRGDANTHTVSMFRFDNYLNLSSEFTPSVQNVWRHRIEGTTMYAVTRKLRALKSVFRTLRRKKGDLSLNVKLAAEFLGTVQNLRREFVDLRYLHPWARHVLTPEECRVLVQSVSWEEIKDAFFDIAEDKAPGPDGYSPGFYKAVWPIIDEELVRAISEFFITGRLLKQVNTTILALIPKGVICKVEKKVRSFLWKGNSSVGYPKVAWKASSIWVKWIVHTRLQHKSVWTIDEKSGSWGWRKLIWLSYALLPHIEFKIGDGESFSLWHDPWHSLGPLITRFPRGPGLTNTSLSAKLSKVIAEGEWRWTPITDMECMEIIHLLPTIHNGNDFIQWLGDNFTMKIAYDIFRLPGSKVGWYSLLLGPCKIPRYSFVLWIAILEKLSTMDKPWLSHLGGECVLCHREMEIHEHLFFQCSFSRQYLREMKDIVRFSWPNRAWGLDITWALRRWTGRHIVQAAYRALLASIVYHIWQERNRRIFQQIERPSSNVARMAVDEIRQKIISIDLPNLACQG